MGLVWGWLINRSREAETPGSTGAKSDLRGIFQFRRVCIQSPARARYRPATHRGSLSSTVPARPTRRLKHPVNLVLAGRVTNDRRVGRGRTVYPNFWIKRLEVTDHREDVGNIALVPHMLVSSCKLFRSEAAPDGEAGRRISIGTEHTVNQYNKAGPPFLTPPTYWDRQGYRVTGGAHGRGTLHQGGTRPIVGCIYVLIYQKPHPIHEGHILSHS